MAASSNALDPEIPYSLLPARLQLGIRNHIENGLATGGFLTAVFDNDLLKAATKADEHNAPHLPAIMRWLFTYAPAEAWGSPEKAERWRAQGGVNGRAKLHEAWVRGEGERP